MIFFRKPFNHIGFYVIAFALLVIFHRLSPTSMAGPGLDAWVLLLMIIGMIVLFCMGVRNADNNKDKLLIVLIHACGTGVLAYLVFV